MASRLNAPPSSGLGPFVYRLFVTLVELMVIHRKPRRLLETEVIALRHQVAVLQRTPNRPELTDVDQSLTAGLACVIPRRIRHGFIVTPDTLLAWHHRLASARRVYPQRRPSRHCVAGDRERLVVRLATENPT